MKLRIKVLPRENVTLALRIVILILSLGAGFFAIGLIFLGSGVNPFIALGRIFIGSFGSFYGWGETITKAIPLLLIGGGLTVAFRGKFWNIGAESQLVIGAAASTWVGLTLGPQLPSWQIMPLMLLAGFIAGALWAIIPALLRVKFGINEVISTLMFNYIGAEIIKFLVVGPWKGKTQSGFPYTDDLPQQAVFSVLPGTRIHYLTLIVAVVSLVILFILMYRSRFGYEVRVIGENPEAGRYAGINFFKTIILMMVISGGCAGLAGVGELGGIHHHLSYPESLSAGYGFTAIIVAWLAKLNPLLVVFSALFFAGILVGGDAIQISFGLPAATVQVFNGIILLFLIMGDYFTGNRVVFAGRKVWS